MARKIIRSTEQRTVVDRGTVDDPSTGITGTRPVENVEQREVVRTVNEPDADTVYDPGTTAPDLYARPATLISTNNGLARLNARVRAQENWSRQQSSVLHDIDYRLTSLEDGTHIWTSAMSLEQSTWWALWGILMLALGSALAVIITLIFASLLH